MAMKVMLVVLLLTALVATTTNELLKKGKPKEKNVCADKKTSAECTVCCRVNTPDVGSFETRYPDLDSLSGNHRLVDTCSCVPREFELADYDPEFEARIGTGFKL